MAQDIFEQLHAAVKQAESQGQRYDTKGNLLTSPKGALGEMQVMPKTAKDPGFGVAPAKGKDPDELARVGKDYLKAMVDKYGDTQKAVIAYNWGPKNTDNWLASGADPKALPAETQGYVARISKALGSDKLAPLPASKPAEPTESEKTMTNALQSGMSAQNMVKDAGPGYKAAMAMMFLADDKPKTEEDDIWKEAEAPVAEEPDAPSAFAGLDLGYQSPFLTQKPQVAQFAKGGEASSAAEDLAAMMPEMEDASPAPFMAFKSANKQTIGDRDLENMMVGLGTNSTTLGVNLSNMRQGDKDNLAQSLMAAYRQQMGDVSLNVNAIRPVNAPPGIYAGSLSAGIPVGNRDQVMVGVNGLRTPEESRITGYNVGYSGEVGPGRLNAMMMQPKDNPKDRSYQLQYQIPFKADGGMVYRAEGSPETGELTQAEIEAASRPAFVTSKSGIGRTAGPVSQALNSGAAYPAMARGIAETPYNVLGAPVDIATLALRPLGYKEEKPMMGSEWIKNKMTELGIRPGEETDPTLKGFRTAAELGSSVVNPAAPVRAAAQAVEKVGGKAADMLRRVTTPKADARAAEVAAVETPMQEVPALPPKEVSALPPKEMPEVVPVQEPVQLALPLREAAPAKKAKPVASSIYTPLPTENAPFVGRLDEYMASLPGPVQKQQLLNQLKGKFRDYEINRAEEAFKDLGATAKLTPSDALNRIKSVYDPSLYKTTVLPADQSSVNGYYRSMDNPFYNKDTDEGVHLGVIHLNQNVAPEVAQRQQAAHEASRAIKLMNNDYYMGRYPDQMDALQNYIKTSGVQLEPELATKIDKGVDQYRKISSYENEMNAAKDKLMYPNISPEYDVLHNKYADQSRLEDPTISNYSVRTKFEPYVVRDLAEQGNAWLVKNGYEPVKLPNYMEISMPSMHAMNTAPMGLSIHGAFQPVKEHIGMAEKNLNKFMKGTEDAFNKAIGQELPYMGQHASLGGGPSPIAFSRFSEHTTDIPGIGKTDGIYVHELQSDMLDDLRKMGTRGGAKEKDVEEYGDLTEKLKALEKTRAEAYTSGNNKLTEELDNQIVSASGRANILSKRIRNPQTDYGMQEAFAKMETGSKTTQQLMAKNAIAGAIQQGKSFVAFPGVESSQAQLYEKLPRTLKDVVKDLGPGFDMREVTLTSPDGNKSNHNAIVWGPEAAARIQKKGVPFATGGSVDKSNIDHRKYL